MFSKGASGARAMACFLTSSSSTHATTTTSGRSVTTALKAKLAPEEKARLDTRPTNNSQAYVLYLNGVGREVAGNRSSEDLTAAEQLYMQAAALDPGFGLAWAQASILNTEVGSSGEDPARRAKARAQAEEALRVCPNLGEAHAALGLCLKDERKYHVAL